MRRSGRHAAAGSRGLTLPLLALGACVFRPPPPLPGEMAPHEAAAAARDAAIRDAQNRGSGKAAPKGQGEGEALTFEEGDPPELDMSPEEMKAYAKAQGDPEEGDFTLEEALHGLPAEGKLWARFLVSDDEIECELHEQQTPLTVANFVGLARGLRPSKDAESGEWKKVQYFDESEFHRVIPGFMIQGGDPTGSGMGQPGYVIQDEFREELRHDGAGRLSMANRGPGTGSAQFFITLGPTPHLDDKHTIFGQCTEAGVEIAERIASTAGPEDRPTSPQRIETVIIERRP
jgi:peptidyl-prolyl cis-trans isomerase A (cyclophilin A)